MEVLNRLAEPTNGRRPSFVNKPYHLGRQHNMLWSALVSTTRTVTDTAKSVTDSDRSKTDRSLPKNGSDLRRRLSVTDSDRYLRDNGPPRARRCNAQEPDYRSLLSLIRVIGELSEAVSAAREETHDG